MDDDTFLSTPFKDKDRVKALGARWSPTQRQWYVPAGRDLTPFALWLPESPAAGGGLSAASLALAPARLTLTEPASETDIALRGRGLSLTELLAGVAQAVSQAFRAAVWTLAEVVDARLRNGHVYLELAERDGQGAVLAKAQAVIWASTAAKILPEFERATGAQLGPGIKLLVRARPVFKPQYGFSVEIEAIDPDYTLGDLEAKKREIRTRLQREGLFDANRRLTPPWDFEAVLVVAPDGAAGLGDFQAEAERLARCGACRFDYALSRFQGEGAAEQIRMTLLAALADWRASGRATPDAVVIIRGGGAINDLAWLNDYALARCVCELEIPVLTGIGHERDSTLLDEVAHQAFDTPSKVALGIEAVMARRVADVRSHYRDIGAAAQRATTGRRSAVEGGLGTVLNAAQRQLALAGLRSTEMLSTVRAGAVQALRDAAAAARQSASETGLQARRQLALTRVGADHAFGDIAVGARRGVQGAATAAEALMREIAGQGPDKTLGRGFAIVRDGAGRTVTRAAQVLPDTELDIEWRDGRWRARSVVQGPPDTAAIEPAASRPARRPRPPKTIAQGEPK